MPDHRSNCTNTQSRKDVAQQGNRVATLPSRCKIFASFIAFLRSLPILRSLHREHLKEQILRSQEQSLELERQKEELEAANRNLETMNAKLAAIVTTDGLTGLTNHRTFQERLREEFESAVSAGAALSVLLMDVDNFKKYNDTYGHPAGDAVLRKVAEALRSAASPTDVVARYGGEEFAVIMPARDAASAKSAAERFRMAIEAAPWPERQVTVSIGAATLSPRTSEPTRLTAEADGALYRSKRRGRNCFVHADDPLDATEQNEAKVAACNPVVQQLLLLQEDLFVSVTQAAKESMSQAYDTTVESWSNILNYRDKETEGHSERVTEMTVQLARAIGMNEEEVLYAKWGALLHDIGKMGVPDAILHKPGPLTEEEWVVMRSHTDIAYEMLSAIPFLTAAMDIPYCHHEKWDGSGYPRGLKGEDIPLMARLFAVIDVYDALRSDRPYRPAWSEEKVEAHLRSLEGTHFDPRAVEVFLKMRGHAESSTSPAPCLRLAA